MITIDHTPFDLAEEIGTAMRACIERVRLAEDAERASREVFLRGQRERQEAAARASLAVHAVVLFVSILGVAAVYDMRMGGVL